MDGFQYIGGRTPWMHGCMDAWMDGGREGGREGDGR